MKLGVTLLLICLLAFACKSTKETITEPESSEDNLIISMSKGACFGTCPVYTLDIHKGGFCTFHGRKNTKKKGKFAKKLSKEDYKNLVNAFKDSNFMEFEDHYESNIADLPSVSISYVEGGVKKSVLGKRERPEALHKLQFKLETIAESLDDWTLMEAPSEEELKKEEPKLIKSEIILTTLGGPQLARWFDNMRQEYSVRIMKKLSDTSDMWLISYNKKRFSPEEMLSILQNDPFVKSAEFNQEVEKR